MNAQFRNQFSQLAALGALSPVVRDHVRLGVDDANERASPGVATSFAVLDAFLPWRGWPVGAMSEIMTDTTGCGELSLLLPAMSRLTREKRPILCIGAPHTLFAPALTHAGIDPARITQINPSSSSSSVSNNAKNTKENLWSAEQALKTGLPGMVVLWSPQPMSVAPEALRRLHLATLGRDTMLIHFRGKSSMSQASPAWLRFGFAADDTHIRLQVLKCRGRLLTRPLITLDRASVQARLYAQLRAAKALNAATSFGLTSTASAARIVSTQQPHETYAQSGTH